MIAKVADHICTIVVAILSAGAWIVSGPDSWAWRWTMFMLVVVFLIETDSEFEKEQ